MNVATRCGAVFWSVVAACGALLPLFRRHGLLRRARRGARLLGAVGLGVGPVVVGLMTDHLFRNPADIGYALAIVVGVAAPTTFCLLMVALRPYRALRGG